MSFYSYGDLQRRGWTKASVRDFLGEPDDTAPNPHYPGGAPMKLYAQARVHGVEQTQEFLEWEKKSHVRRKAAKGAADTKRAALMAEVDKIEIQIPDFKSRNVLVSKACRKYNIRWRGLKHADHTCSSEFLERLIVNFLRHECTEYDGKVRGLFRKVGKKKAYELLFDKVCKAIVAKYPWLKEECDRQFLRRCETRASPRQHPREP